MPLFTWVTLLGEGFEAGFSGWYVGNGGGTGTWVTYPYGTIAYEPDGSGTSYAICDGRSNEIYADTLVSPAVYVAGYDSLRLVYSYAFSRENYSSSDSGTVMVRYHDGSAWGPWIGVRRYDNTLKGRDTIYLTTGYDSLQVAFAYYSQDAAYWFAVDDVKVEGRTLYTYDVEATAILVPLDLHYRGEYISTTVRITNRGTTDVHTDVRLYVLYGTDTVFRGSADFIANTGEYYDVPMGFFVPESLGTHVAVAIVNADTDYYAGNDTVSKTFKVLPYPDVVFGIPFAPSVTVDGVASPGEWGSAHRVDVSNYFGKHSPPTDTGVVRAYFQHDGSYLNVLVETGDNTYDSTDALFIFVDDDGDRIWERGEGLNLIGGRPYSGWATRDSGQAYVFPRKDLMLRAARLGGTFEISVPMARGTEPDVGVLHRGVGEHISLFVAYRDGRTGKFLAWWPQTEDLPPDTFGPANTYLTLQRPDNWHDVGLSLLPSECEAQQVCSTAVVIYDNYSLFMDVETLRVRVERDGTPILSLERPLNVPYASVDTFYVRWTPSDSGHYRVKATLTSDDSPGNDTAVLFVPVGRPISPPYVQDFEGRWPPAGWKVEGRGWVPGHYLGDARISPTYGSSGEGFAEFLSFVLPSGDSSALYLPPILSTGGSHISLKVWNGPTWTGRGNYDRVDLYYRTAGSGVWHPLGSVYGDMPSWQERTFNLPEADTVYVKLVARSDFGDTDISIDDLAVLPGLALSEGRKEEGTCSVSDGIVRARPGTEVRVYTADGRLHFKGRVGTKGTLLLPRKHGVYFVLCNRVVIGGISPLK